MPILRNAVLEWTTAPDTALLERVLWLDAARTQVVTFELRNPTAIPVWRAYDELERAVQSGQARLLDQDPFAPPALAEAALPDSHRQRRDAAWAAIEPLVTDSTGALFQAPARTALIQAATARSGRVGPTIWRDLRRYWRGGQIKNALLPRYNACGGPGKPKHLTIRRIGRPPAPAPAQDLVPVVVIDAAVQEKFRRGIALFYARKAGTSLHQAYELTLQRFFHHGYEVQHDVLVPVLPPTPELPSFRQFYYWYHKNSSPTQTLTARKGRTGFAREDRALLSAAASQTLGPGSLYQVDATLANVYLVSELDRTRIIGQSVVYKVIDVFTWMVAGLHVGLNAPSWLGAMLALENAFTAKADYCRAFGVALGAEDWPCHYLCEALVGDRGELEGYAADNLANGLGIRVDNTPPYRPDLKGHVEQSFNLDNLHLNNGLPGAVPARRLRGERDPRQDACVTLREYTQLLIWTAWKHNHAYRLTTHSGVYRLDADMLADGLEPYPIALWNWGLQNRAGHLRAADRTQIRLHLLPQAEATITRRGLVFRGLRYSAPWLEEHPQELFVRAGQRGAQPITVVYDPRLVDYVYLRDAQTRLFERAELVESEAAFRGQDWFSVADHFQQNRAAEAARQTYQREIDSVFAAQKDQIVQAAQREKAAGGPPVRGQIQKTSIRANRAEERAAQNQREAWTLPPQLPPGPESAPGVEEPGPATRGDTAPAPHPAGEGAGYIPLPQQSQWLRQLREQRRRVPEE